MFVNAASFSHLFKKKKEIRSKKKQGKQVSIRLETKSGRILPLNYVTKYDMN